MLALVCAILLAADTYPRGQWESRLPAEVGLDIERLEALSKLVQGRGCIVRRGFMVYTWGDVAKSSDVASAVKPVISTLLFMAIQEGKLKSVDEPVSLVDPRLAALNGGKDAGITWRQLASQTSGYGLSEPPGKAYGYNDFALALYYDTLMQQVFKEDGTEVLKERLAGPLQFQDRYTFQAINHPMRDGRLAISVRDFARFGLLYMRGGRWRDQQIIDKQWITLAINSPIAADTPLAVNQDSDMLPMQRSIGGGKRITSTGPGYYSFNWWLNRTDNRGRKLYRSAPNDAFVAAGHGGKRMLFVIPSWDIIACWNDSPLDDHDASPERADTKCNQAIQLLAQAIKR